MPSIELLGEAKTRENTKAHYGYYHGTPPECLIEDFDDRYTVMIHI